MVDKAILIIFEDFKNVLLSQGGQRIGEFFTNFEKHLSALAVEKNDSTTSILRFLSVLHACNKGAIQFIKESITISNELKRLIIKKINDEVPAAVNRLLGTFGVLNAQNLFDWRLQRRLLDLNEEIHNLKISKDELLRKFEEEIDSSSDFLLWQNESNAKNIEISKWILNKLKYTLVHCKANPTGSKIIEGIIQGRLSKEVIGGEITLIFGENGGLFALLNNRSYLADSLILGDKNVTEEYLESKSVLKYKKMVPQITIGSGAFGKVRFALSLLESQYNSPGDLVCVKKSESAEDFNQNDQNIDEPSACALYDFTENSLLDYFAKDYADIIKGPLIKDISVVWNQEVAERHKKSYVFMEIFPQQTGAVCFAQGSKYLKWEYQKPFLLDIFEGIKKLLERNIVYTDLKLQNTLFDPITRKAVIIDLGGVLKLKDKQSLENFNLDYTISLTERFCAPEVLSYFRNAAINLKINWVHAVLFSCGKLLENTVRYNTSPNNEYSEALELIIAKCLNEAPHARGSIDELIVRILTLGANDFNKYSGHQAYIDRTNEVFLNEPSLLSLNEDLLKSREIFISLEATKENPQSYNRLGTSNLSKTIDDFFSEMKEEVMLLLGPAGSGKSLILQIKFYEAVKKWKPGASIPLYFNLANETNLDKIIDNMNKKLKSNIKLGSGKMNLFIDSFDEGLEMKRLRENLINKYLKAAGADVKILVTCRTEYLDSVETLSWFKNESSKHKLHVAYIAPLNYSGKRNLKDLATRWMVKNEQGMGKDLKSLHEREELIKILDREDISALIDTGFMFEAVMSCINQIKELQQNTFLTKTTIYKMYVDFILKEKIKGLSKCKKEKVQKYLGQNEEGSAQENNIEAAILTSLEKMGVELALKVLELNQHRIPVFECFPNLKFNPKKNFKAQMLYQILRLLPLKIEMKISDDADNQEVRIGFQHETLKNIFFVKSLTFQILNGAENHLLERSEFLKDPELLTFIVESLDAKLKQKLKEIVLKTKEGDNYFSEKPIKMAANAMSILVAARERFWDQDLSQINIRGANLTGGDFRRSNFQSSDLSDCVMHHTNFDLCNLSECFLTNIKLGMNYTILTGHKDSVRGVAFLEDNKLLSASEDFTVGIWSLTLGKLVKSLAGHTNKIYDLAVTSDLKLFATASVDGTVRIWDSSGCLRVLNAHSSGVVSVAISPDNSKVISGGNDSKICVWDMKQGTLIKKIDAHFSSVQAIAFSPSLVTWASGSLDGIIKIWDYKTMEVIEPLACSEQEVWSLCFSPDGKTLAAGYKSFCLLLWNLTYGGFIKVEGLQAGVAKVEFTKDGKKVLTASLDKTVRLWDRETGNLLETFTGHTDGVLCATLSPDSTLIASGARDKTIRFWKTSSERNEKGISHGHKENIHSLAFSPDGKYLLSGSWDNTALIWDLNTGLTIQQIAQHKNWVNAVAYSPDGKLIATASADETVLIISTDSWAVIHTLRGHSDRLRSVVFSPDGNWIATAANDNSIRFWETKTGKPQGFLQAHSSFISCLAFFPNGSLIASCSIDKSVRLWNFKERKCIFIMNGHSNNVNFVDVSPKGTHILSASSDQTIKKWDVTNGKEVQVLKGHKSSVFCVKYSTDGRVIASGGEDNQVILWDGERPELLRVLEKHTNHVYSIAFSRDSTMIATGSRDRSICLWELDQDTSKNDISESSKILMAKEDKVRSGALYSLKHTLPKSESGISAKGAIVKKCIIGKANELIFEMKGAHTGMNNENEEEEGEVPIKFENIVAPIPPHSQLGNQSIPGIDMTNPTSSGAPRIVTKSTVCFSPDGKYIACGTLETRVEVWSIESASINHFNLDHKDWIHAVRYSNKGDVIAVAVADGSITVIGATDLINKKTLMGHKQKVRDLGFSPDDTFLASCSNDSTVILWDVKAGIQIWSFLANGLLSSLSYSPLGDKIVSCSTDTTLQLWDLSSYQMELIMPGHSGFVNCVCFSPNAKLIVSCSNDKTIRTWDTSNGNNILVLKRHVADINYVVFFPNGKHFASCCAMDNSLIIWDALSGNILQIVNEGIGYNCIAVSPKGELLVVGGLQGELSVLRAEGKQEANGFKNFILFKRMLD